MSTAVLIPLFNHERYIQAALNSISTQTVPPDHVIIIDDGSSDQSVAVVQDWIQRNANRPFALELYAQENVGAHVTINRAVDLVAQKGCEFVAILNSDDMFASERLEVGISFLKANPTIELVCTQLAMVDEEGSNVASTNYHAIWLNSLWSIGRSATVQNHFCKWLGYGNFAVTTSNFIARTAWLKQNCFAAYRYAHDYALLIRTALQGKLGVLERELLKYRVHARNTIKTKSSELIRELVQLNVDLAVEIAPRLLEDASLRAAYSEYRQASWQNISAFRADLFELAAAQAFAKCEAYELPQELEELQGFRNLHVANLGAQTFESLLKEKEFLTEELKKEKAERRAMKELRDLQLQLAKSRWFALGRVLNLGEVNWVLQTGGKTALEKLSTLKYRLAANGWVQLGRRLGSQLQKLELP